MFRRSIHFYHSRHDLSTTHSIQLYIPTHQAAQHSCETLDPHQWASVHQSFWHPCCSDVVNNVCLQPCPHSSPHSNGHPTRCFSHFLCNLMYIEPAFLSCFHTGPWSPFGCLLGFHPPTYVYTLLAVPPHCLSVLRASHDALFGFLSQTIVCSATVDCADYFGCWWKRLFHRGWVSCFVHAFRTHKKVGLSCERYTYCYIQRCVCHALSVHSETTVWSYVCSPYIL